MHNNIITKTTEKFNTINSFVCIKNSYIQSHKIEALCTHKTRTGQKKINIIAKNCFIYLFNKIKKIDNNIIKINFCELQRYCGGKDRATIRRALNYLEDKKIITKFFKRFAKEGKFITEVFITVNMEVITDITNKNESKIHDFSMGHFCTVNKQNTYIENIANIKNESSFDNEKKYNCDVREILSCYSILNKSSVDRLVIEINQIIKDKKLEFDNSFRLKRYIDKILFSLKEKFIEWNGVVSVLSFGYKMQDIRINSDLLKEINDKAMRQIPEWLCIKLMNKLGSGKVFKTKDCFVDYMSKVFAKEMRGRNGTQDNIYPKEYDEFDFINTGDIDKARKVLERFNDVSKIRRKGVDLLYTACMNGYHNIAKMLIDKSCDVKLEYSGGYNAFFASLVSNNFDVVRLLVENGFDVNHKLTDGKNALIFGLQYGLNNLDIIDYLIELGLDVNYKTSSSETALINTVKYSNIEVVKYLIDKGASFIRGRDGCANEFLIAIKSDRFDIADLIVENDEKTRELVKNEEIKFAGFESYYISRNKKNNEISDYYKSKIIETIRNDGDEFYLDTRIIKVDNEFIVNVKNSLTEALIIKKYNKYFDNILGEGKWKVFGEKGVFCW